MKAFLQRLMLWALAFGAVAYGFIEHLIPALYERRRKAAEDGMKKTVDAVGAKHGDRQVATNAAVAAVEKQAEATKKEDSVDVANRFILDSLKEKK